MVLHVPWSPENKTESLNMVHVVTKRSYMSLETRAEATGDEKKGNPLHPSPTKPL
jgi:hypothetical protein